MCIGDWARNRLLFINNLVYMKEKGEAGTIRTELFTDNLVKWVIRLGCLSAVMLLAWLDASCTMVDQFLEEGDSNRSK